MKNTLLEINNISAFSVYQIAENVAKACLTQSCNISVRTSLSDSREKLSH